MAKLKLVANPTFKAKVGIPIAGGDPVDVEMTFKHRTRSALEQWVSSRAEKSDVESFMDMVVGWELDDEFTRENAELLLENYAGTGLATYRAYVGELMQAKLGN